jgi:2,3-bisphosphoglycerate-dependent phosphoglycerate mutase
MFVYFIRHGQTQYNADGRIQGWLDVPLNTEGLDQAERLAQRLGGKPIEVIYASPLMRARDTALAVATRRKLDVRTDDRLREYNMGIWSGRTGDEIGAKFPNFVLDDPNTAIPEGETAMDMHERVSSFLADLIARHTGQPGRLAVVTHGGTLGALLGAMLNMPVMRRHPFTFGNTSITEAVWSGQRWRLRSMNDRAHLV